MFRGATVILEEYNGYKVTEGLMKKKELVEKVAKKVREPPFIVIDNEVRINPSKCLRAHMFMI